MLMASLALDSDMGSMKNLVHKGIASRVHFYGSSQLCLPNPPQGDKSEDSGSPSPLKLNDLELN